MLRQIVLPLVLSLCATTATAADFSFCWTGGNGYTMTGRMQVPDALMSNAILTEEDVTSFKIAGYLEGTLLGTWDMTQHTAQTTWHLRFDPIAMTFLTGGRFATTRSQGWNADGEVENCGNPGFGFNSGSYAQDICVNGQYIADSSIAPETPLIATFGAVTPTCERVSVTSKSPKTNHSD